MLTIMAELDYAYLADYAQVEGGKISALGASYTHAVVDELPAGWLTTVVGRVRIAEDEAPVSLRIEVAPPGNMLRLRTENTLDRAAGVRPYDGKVGLLFAATLQLPITASGLCTFDIYVNESHARRLAFEVEHTESS